MSLKQRGLNVKKKFGWFLLSVGSIWSLWFLVVLGARLLSYFAEDMILFVWGSITSFLIGMILLGLLLVYFGIRNIKGEGVG